MAAMSISTSRGGRPISEMPHIMDVHDEDDSFRNLELPPVILRFIY